MKLDNLNLPALQDLSKADFNLKANQLAALVEDGFIDALDMDIRLKAMIEVIEIARKTIKPLLVAKVERDGTKDLYGCKIALKNGNKLLDYCSDGEYNSIKERLAQRKELLDMAYSIGLKGIQSTHPETGEIIKIIPVKSYGEDSISYTFKK